MQLMECLFERRDQEELRQFSGMARRIWLRRNDLIHGGGSSHPRVIMQQTTKSMLEFTLANENGDR
jgi:hypothetical protein